MGAMFRAGAGALCLATSVGCAQIADIDPWPGSPGGNGAASSSVGVGGAGVGGAPSGGGGEAAASTSSSVASGGAASSSTASTGGQPTITCVTSLSDDFADNDPLPLWAAYTVNDATIAEASGRVAISLTATLGEAQAGYYTPAAYDLRGCSIQIGVPEVPSDTASTAYANLGFSNAAEVAQNVNLSKSGTDISLFDSDGNGVYLPYSPAMVQWRLDIEADRIVAHVLVDGTWTEVGSLSLPGYLEAVQIGFAAGLSQYEELPSGAQFEMFSVGPLPL